MKKPTDEEELARLNREGALALERVTNAEIDLSGARSRLRQIEEQITALQEKMRTKRAR